MATGTGRRGICLARACALALPRDRRLQDPEVKDPLSDVVSVIIALIPGARRLRSLLNYRLSSRQTMYPFQPSLPFYLFPPSTARFVTLLRFSSTSCNIASPRSRGRLDGLSDGPRAELRPAPSFLPRLSFGSLVISRNPVILFSQMGIERWRNRK